MLLFAWLYLTRIAYRVARTQLPGTDSLIRHELSSLGPVSKQEIGVAVVFALVALAWISRGFLDFPLLQSISDSTIAVAGALLLFLIPADLGKGEFLLDWETAVKLPWDVIILFGGGFALAQGIGESGLSEWSVTWIRIFRADAECKILVSQCFQKILASPIG